MTRKEKGLILLDFKKVVKEHTLYCIIDFHHYGEKEVFNDDFLFVGNNQILIRRVAFISFPHHKRPNPVKDANIVRQRAFERTIQPKKRKLKLISRKRKKVTHNFGGYSTWEAYLIANKLTHNEHCEVW